MTSLIFVVHWERETQACVEDSESTSCTFTCTVIQMFRTDNTSGVTKQNVQLISLPTFPTLHETASLVVMVSFCFVTVNIVDAMVLGIF